MGLQSFDIILDKDFNQNSFLNFTGEIIDYYNNKEYLEKESLKRRRKLFLKEKHYF
jgi:uncharacterized protein (DUF2147 family)